MIKFIKKLFKDSKGQGIVEYGIIIILVSISVIGAVILLGGKSGTSECIAELDGSYIYTKNEDSGLRSLYSEISCKLGQFDAHIKNEIDKILIGSIRRPKTSENPDEKNNDDDGLTELIRNSIDNKKYTVSNVSWEYYDRTNQTPEKRIWRTLYKNKFHWGNLFDNRAVITLKPKEGNTFQSTPVTPTLKKPLENTYITKTVANGNKVSFTIVFCNTGPDCHIGK